MHGIDLVKKDPRRALEEDLAHLADRHNIILYGFACVRPVGGDRGLLAASPEQVKMALDGFAGSYFEHFTEEERTALADALKAVLRAVVKAKGVA